MCVLVCPGALSNARPPAAKQANPQTYLPSPARRCRWTPASHRTGTRSAAAGRRGTPSSRPRHPPLPASGGGGGFRRSDGQTRRRTSEWSAEKEPRFQKSKHSRLDLVKDQELGGASVSRSKYSRLDLIKESRARGRRAPFSARYEQAPAIVAIGQTGR